MNTSRMRELAEKATPGKWKSNETDEDLAAAVWTHDATTAICAANVFADAPTMAEKYQPDDEVRHNNMRYIAACSPDEILKLLDVVDAARKRLEVWTPETYAALKDALAALDQPEKDA